MALHQSIQRVLLIGSRLHIPPPPPAASPPERLLPLIEALAPAHLMFDARAVHYGHRYRSGFWAIYLLSAIAVLFAVLPLALGWADRRGERHLLGGTQARLARSVAARPHRRGIDLVSSPRSPPDRFLATRALGELVYAGLRSGQSPAQRRRTGSDLRKKRVAGENAARWRLV